MLRYIVFCCLIIGVLNASPTIKGPPIAEKKHLKQIVHFGSDVKIVCPISGFPAPIFEWFKDGEVIDNYSWIRYRIAKKSLKIKGATMDDTGIFVCKGTNGFGTVDSRIDLIVIDPARYGNLGIDEEPSGVAPILTLETEQLRLAYRKTTGDHFQLTCEALAQPDAEVSWYKDQIPISDYRVQHPFPGRSVLTIDRVIKGDSGLYTCVAKNSFGEAAKNFTLDVIGEQSKTVTSIDPEIDFMPNPNTPMMPNGPENTTVEQGDRAVLECMVQSNTVPNIKWLKKLEPKEYEQTLKKDIIDLGPEKFKVLPAQGEVQVFPNSDEMGRDKYVNKLVIPETSETDAGMYYCFVKNPIGYEFKSAYLTVVPKTIAPIGGLESSPILIIVICLAVLVLFLLVSIIICVLRKRQKDACQNSTISETPEVRENLLRQQGVYHQQIQQQPYVYQHQTHQTNNNQRSTLGQMNIFVNKLDQPLPSLPAPPAPPPPPPSTAHSSMVPSSHMHSMYKPRHTTSTSNSTYIPGLTENSHHSGGSVANNYAISQNQYEVPHVVRYGQIYNDQFYSRNQQSHMMHY